MGAQGRSAITCQQADMCRALQQCRPSHPMAGRDVSLNQAAAIPPLPAVFILFSPPPHTAPLCLKRKSRELPIHGARLSLRALRLRSSVSRPQRRTRRCSPRRRPQHPARSESFLPPRDTAPPQRSRRSCAYYMLLLCAVRAR
jgi:hypothetical protein